MGRRSELNEFADAHARALRAAYRQIRPNRRSMSLDEAERIVREEFANRDLRVAEVAIRQYASVLHRWRFWWPRKRAR